MPDVEQHAHHTVAEVPGDSWNQAWHSLVSWKGYLQSVPGFLAVRVAARALEGGDVRVLVTTLWEHREQLEEWVASPWGPRDIFHRLTEPARVLSDEVLEELM